MAGNPSNRPSGEGCRWPLGGTMRLVVAAFIAAMMIAPAAAQTGLEPRVPGAKSSLKQMQAMPASRRVVVKFNEGLSVRKKSGALTGLGSSDLAALSGALAAERVPLGTLRRMHARPETELDRERSAGERESGRRLSDLNLYFVIDLPKGVSAASVAARLNRLSFIEFAEPGPVPAPAPFDIPPATPNLLGTQDYRNAPPEGVGALSPAVNPGAAGKGLRYADIEYSWQLNHEDLELPNSRILTGGATLDDPFDDTNHGTAVLGEISGKSNGYGVTGLAYQAVVYVSPANTTQFGYDPARAIGIATGRLVRGDVMVIEQQYWVCGLSGDAYGPLEVLQSVFDAVSAATAKGIIVVAAAGNGSVNLDMASCGGLFNRATRDSNAIIVGAGSSTTHARLSFSSYGSRVDVQAWGENVATTGYGDAFDPGDVRQLYTGFFSGTSSATPIVSGAVLQIQGVVKACGVPLLSPRKMRTILVRTGTAQANPGTGHIGPLPRIRQALLSTAARDCVLNPPPNVSAAAVD